MTKLEAIMKRYGCDADTARMFMDLREEGRSRRFAEMALGLTPARRAA
jgi:cytidylate kinase